MPNLAKYTVQLEAQVARYEKNLDRANRKLDRFNKQQTKNLDRVKAGFVKLGATIAATLGGAKLASQLVKTERATGVLRAQLETATGSVQGAADAFSRLEAFAARTPFALEESVTAFTRLVNLGLTPSERALISYGNTAAATGKTILQFVEAAADASVGEFERLKEFGIKASKEGDKVTFRFRGLTTEVGNNTREIEEFLIGLGETEFAGGLERRIETLDGKLSNLGDAWDALFRTINDSGVGNAIKGSIDVAIRAVEGLEGVLDKLLGQELLGLQSELGKLNKQIDSAASGGFFSAFTDQDELNEKLRRRAEILERIKELTNATSGGPRPLATLESFSQLATGQKTEAQIEAEADAYERLQERIRQANEIAAAGTITTGPAGTTVGVQTAAEAADEIFKKFDEMNERRAAAADRFNTLFADNLVQAASSSFDDVLDGWVRTLQQMAAQLLASQVFKILSGIGGGGAGSFGGFVTDLFGGSFAQGGVVPGRIGEPKLIVAHAGERVIPIGESGGGQMVFNIDASGATPGIIPMIEEGVARAVRLSAQDRLQQKRRGK